MKFYLSVFICFIFYTVSFSQNIPFIDEQLKNANTAADIQQLSQLEKDVILYINLVRMYPKQFFNQYAFTIKDIDELKDEPNFISLKETLLENNATTPLYIDDNLVKMATELANDIGPHGIDGHTNSKKENFWKRSKKFGLNGEAAENIDFGNNNALEIVFSWLIDLDVANLGHRMNLLNGELAYIGIKYGNHSTYNYCCVIDLRGK